MSVLSMQIHRSPSVKNWSWPIPEVTDLLRGAATVTNSPFFWHPKERGRMSASGRNRPLRIPAAFDPKSGRPFEYALINS
ncbi:hypothetical protein O9649_16940 [Achromobacter dolens]|uniref:hypothetical protein n=1 Tax=Achromobacter dolens TaxID=1287738 RepID=UPI0022B8BB6F|nr:hypothetical protein [Achromobacter dolens]MCZ8409482.1 hypothetical protein [Achromobacter dolens]